MGSPARSLGPSSERTRSAKDESVDAPRQMVDNAMDAAELPAELREVWEHAVPQ